MMIGYQEQEETRNINVFGYNSFGNGEYTIYYPQIVKVDIFSKCS